MDSKFWKAAGVRALRTVCQTALAMMGTSIYLQEVNWTALVSASVLAGVASLLTSIVTGLPEVNGHD